MTRILVVIGTPLADSLNHALAHAYIDAARTAGAQVDVVDLARDAIPEHPAVRQDLRVPRTDDDPTLDAAIAAHVARIDAADHLALFFPQWWGTYPAAFKSWIDRAILSGSAFRYKDGRGWAKLLTGRTARIVMTMDSPRWWNWWMYRDAAVRALKVATLWYVGVTTVGVERIPEVRHASPARLERSVASMARLGKADALRTPSPSITRAADRVPAASA
ncbi:NAD(P)H-dependent oxidoreductase [Demequina sp. NBRC 110056]|uniref:NAD(P)H-dependent oxidoreductase n=1 Tax=Demequina sp. NBRC 110056 TaxID=1570345 RepID=UPI0009FBD569|nr:NAD(P)H-dependent oxidoreductase [Demequina sp. NBRC 110056]